MWATKEESIVLLPNAIIHDYKKHNVFELL